MFLTKITGRKKALQEERIKGIFAYFLTKITGRKKALQEERINSDDD